MSMTGISWRERAAQPGAVFAIWALFSAILLASLAVTGTDPTGPDDWMRLFEVRDLLHGQSWYDVTQYRIDPAGGGASMHWSRLVDIPLALVAMLFGETAALVAVPLLYLLVAMFLLRVIMQRLGLGPLVVLAGLLIMALFPLLPGSFAPLRIDHHTPQAVLALAAAALLLHPTRTASLLGGAAAAAWCVVSLEGLPMVAALAGIYGAMYLWDGDRRLSWFLAGLAIAAPILSLLTRPVSAFGQGFCDILLPGHMAAFAAAAIIATILPRLPRQDTRPGRLAALAVIPVICGPVAFLALDRCAADPFAELDPLVREYWYGYITEGLPIWKQSFSVIVVLLWTLALVIAGYALAWREGLARGEHALHWASFALLALAGNLYALAVMREAVTGQLLAVPFAALLIAHYLPRARAIEKALPRILATLACLLLVTPTLAGAISKSLDPMFPSATMRPGVLARIDPRRCDFAQLAALPPGHVLSSLDATPEILGKSGHTAVAASYHRNTDAMRDVLAALTGGADQARMIASRNRVDYVVACASKADLALYRTAAPGNFANLLVSGQVPAWLRPVPGFEDGPLRVYRIR